AKIASVDVSAAQKNTVYIAVNNHRQDDFAPRVLRTHDGGKSWSDISAGLPAGHFVDVVRSDPTVTGLLYAGTDAGVFVSFDDGTHWQSLQRNLPTAWVRDLLVHDGDLIAATQGRAIWVLDDLAPLRQHAKLAANADVLFDPAPAIRVRDSQNKDTPPPADTALGENPPNGAIIDYRLAQTAKKVVLEIRDAAGNLVRRFASDRPETVPDAERYFAASWTRKPVPLSATAGMHRFVWNLRLPRPRAVHYDYGINAVFGQGTPIVPQGMLAAPGDYTVALNIDGKVQTVPLKVVPDPRVPLDASALSATLIFGQQVDKALDRDFVAYGQIHDVGAQIEKLGDGAQGKSVAPALAKYHSAVAPLRSGAGHDGENLDDIGGVLSAVAADLEGSDRAPTQPQREVVTAADARLDRALKRWNGVQKNELAALNAALKSAGKAEIRVPAADQVRLRDVPEAKDLP
ncbi:MAG: hypothetical protein KGH80_09520, partial [Xanthomonadaceae bacterium]|nr:hypothetical protein [Xanthomonadaceae bacterium]